MGSETTYDVFLSYTSADREVVLGVAKALKDRGCSSFLDQWYLKPGHDWVEALERALAASKSVAVFLGPHEMGRWQQRERAWALDRLAEHEDFPVVPVLLPGCEPPLGFLKQLMWIDLRDDPTSATRLDALAAAIRGDEVDLDDRPQPRAMICPYRGLLAFREEDADFFFGRDKYLKQLVSLVERQTLIAVVGASGSGKSSLVSAGLVPQLRKHGDGPVWDVVRMVPNVDPLYSLAEGLVPLIEPDLSRLALERELNAVANDLEQEKPTTPLWGLVNAVLRQQPGTERLLLFVDQWEELYTNCEKPARRERFIAELLEATSRKDSSVSVVLTVRSDFVGEMYEDRPLLDRLQDAELKLGPMNADELRSVIEGPAENVGLTFQDGLVDRTLKEAGEEPGRLPLLEFALEELWKRRDGVQLTHAGYEDLGRQPDQKAADVEAEKSDCLSRAIATYAEGVYGELSADERETLPGLFRKLVRAGAKTEDDTRRRAALSELDETTRRVARKLADKRLLITTETGVGERATEKKDSDVEEDLTSTDQASEGGEASTTVEVAHEELLRRWVRLKEWVNEDRQFLLWRSRLDLKVEEYGRDGDAALFSGKPLQESKKFYPAKSMELEESERRFLDASLKASRRRKLVFVGSVCAALILVAIIGFGWYRSGRSRTADNLVESLLATPAGTVDFYLDWLEPYQDLAIPTLREEFANGERIESQRAHAAYALIRFDAAGSDEIRFLLDSIPTLHKDEDVNLVVALAKAHQRQPLDDELGQRVDQASSAFDSSRYLAISLGLGITDRAQAICKLQEDPAGRTSLIHGFKEFPGDSTRVAQVVETTEDPELRSAVCIAIGTLGLEAAEETGPVLKRLYAESPDGGTHGAAGWALQQQGLTNTQLEQLTKQYSDSSGTRGWEVIDIGENSRAITMLKIPGVEFRMGPVDDDTNPANDVEPELFEPFWLSDREVSVGQFYAVMNKIRGDKEAEDMGNPLLPVASVTWFDAVEFCNALSERKGLKPPFYYKLDVTERDADGSIANAVVTEGVGKGYRLPTEKEWEYACRAGSTTEYCFGDDPVVLAEYGVYRPSTKAVCGSRMPNGWGLFDMHGNVEEWCWDKSSPNSESRVLRGGSFSSLSPRFLRSAYRAGTSPDDRYDLIGFRISRTP